MRKPKASPAKRRRSTNLPALPPAVPFKPTFLVSVPFRFVILTSFVTAALSFAAGCAVRHFLIDRQLRALELVLRSDAERASSRRRSLPPPMVKGRKVVPQTVYTTRNYDTSRSVSSSLFLQVQPDEVVDEDVDPDGVDFNSVDVGTLRSLTSSPRTPRDNTTIIFPEPFADQENSTDNDDETHLPAGQHLLVDFNNIDQAFLSSESRLAVAMVEMVYECGLTMLSYHCHRLFPSGVSCAGVLLESHVSFHTWPEEGVITLDLFTCGANSLLPMMPMIESLFGVARPGGNKPEMLWAYKRRGFTDVNVHADADGASSNRQRKAEPTDLFAYPLGSRGLEMKKEIVSVEATDHRHRIRIYDVIQAPTQSLERHARSLAANTRDGLSSSYEAKHPDLFRPDRLVFVNGVLQARRSRDAPTHEALVHPAMLAHHHPASVALISGGLDGGAALREVLKHRTVTGAVVSVPELTLVDMSREHMAEWNDCSNISGASASSCFDDKRVRVVSRLGAGQWLATVPYGTFDVVVVDSLLSNIEPGEGMDHFLHEAYRSLASDGILVFYTIKSTQAGDLPVSPMQMSKAQKRYEANLDTLVRKLELTGFASTRSYDEKQDGYVNKRSFVVAFKAPSGAERWDRRTEPQVSLDIARRIAKTKDGLSSLRFFDGSSMRAHRKSQHDDQRVYHTFQNAQASGNKIKPRSLLGPTPTNHHGLLVDSNASSLHGGRRGKNHKSTPLAWSDVVRVQPFLAGDVSLECASGLE